MSKHPIKQYSIQDVDGAEVNTDKEKYQASDMSSLHSDDSALI
jgi:hypothetical protein